MQAPRSPRSHRHWWFSHQHRHLAGGFRPALVLVLITATLGLATVLATGWEGVSHADAAYASPTTLATTGVTSAAPHVVKVAHVASARSVHRPLARKVQAKAPAFTTKVAAPVRHDTPKPAAPQHTTSVQATPSGYGCADALAYLSTHSAPGFQFECPGYALGHQAMTCIDVAGVCAGIRLIAIADPCAAAYMNEASNSWVELGLRSAPIDPYGYCQ